MSIEEKVAGKVNDLIVGEADTFVVDVALQGNIGNQKLLVFLDADQGLDIDVCSKISRELSAWLDENEVVKGKYILEVSSPGVDMPLKLVRQYVKNIGRQVKIQLADNKNVVGELITASNVGVVVRTKADKKRKEEAREVSLSFDEILKTKVQVTF